MLLFDQLLRFFIGLLIISILTCKEPIALNLPLDILGNILLNILNLYFITFFILIFIWPIIVIYLKSIKKFCTDKLRLISSLILTKHRKSPSIITLNYNNTKDYESFVSSLYLILKQFQINAHVIGSACNELFLICRLKVDNINTSIRLIGLTSDIKSRLGVESLRINERNSLYTTLEIIKERKVKVKCAISSIIRPNMFIILGANTDDQPLTINLYSASPILIAGSNGTGKSQLINGIMMQIETQNLASVIIISEQIQQYRHGNANKIFKYSEAVMVLKRLVDEARHRSATITHLNKINLQATYKLFTKERPIVLIIDELDSFIGTDWINEILLLLTQLMDNLIGIYVIITTSEPSAPQITKFISMHFAHRILFYISNPNDRKVVAPKHLGLEHLLHSHDALYLPPGGPAIRFITDLNMIHQDS